MNITLAFFFVVIAVCERYFIHSLTGITGIALDKDIQKMIVLRGKKKVNINGVL